MAYKVLRRTARWSKNTDDLVRNVALGCRPGLQAELGRWLDASPRFGVFVTTHKDKIRKKLSTSDEEARLDVRAELLVASRLLADRRFDVSFEAYGARTVGPDLSVEYRTNQRFNIEVTRLRAAAGEAGTMRLANLIAGKLRQMPPDVPNVLVINARGLSLTEAHLLAAVRLLKLRTDTKDEAFFTSRGIATARDFHAQFLRLGGIVALDESTEPASVTYWANSAARHTLPVQAMRHVVAGLNASDQRK